MSSNKKDIDKLIEKRNALKSIGLYRESLELQK